MLCLLYEGIKGGRMTLLKNEDLLLNDVKFLIEQSHERVSAVFNEELTLLYWNVGYRINKDILGWERA